MPQRDDIRWGVTNTRKAELYASLAEREPRWYVAAIIAGMEATAVEHLSRQGFAPYVPMMVDRVVGDRGKRIETRRPRFKGYGFLSLDLDVDRWRSVNGTRGVRHLLPPHLERPTSLPVGFVERIMAEPERAEEIIALYAANEMVRVVAGQFVGQVVKVERQSGRRIWARTDNGASLDTTTDMVERA